MSLELHCVIVHGALGQALCGDIYPPSHLTQLWLAQWTQAALPAPPVSPMSPSQCEKKALMLCIRSGLRELAALMFGDRSPCPPGP